MWRVPIIRGRKNERMRSFAVLLFLGFSPVITFGQYSLYPDFGKVGPQDFRISSPVVDSNANVVVLEDVGKTQLEGYDRGWRVGHLRYRRLLIRNRKGMDAARIVLSYPPAENGNDKLYTLQANTYNLEGGKVVQTKVGRDEMFLDPGNDGELKERWSFPDVREGSIIEYTYFYYSGSIYQLYPWDFQGKYPCLKSEYTVTFPAAFNYVYTLQGPYDISRTVDSARKTIAVGTFTVQAMTFTIRWLMADVPAMQQESYLYDPHSYVAGIRFQLYEYTQLDTKKRIKVDDTWKTVNDKLYRYKAFGGILSDGGRWERKELRAIAGDENSDMGKAKALYEFVRDHFVAGSYDIFSDNRTLREIFDSRKGNVAEINLLLTALMRGEGLAADAVVLSTRDNGLLDPYYPLTENLNYVIVRVRIDGLAYFLDASDRALGFGRLPLKCYNGYSRVISSVPDSVLLRPDSVVESSFNTVFLSTDGAGGGMSGTYTKTQGYYGSQEIRKEIASKGEKVYFEEAGKSYPFDVRIGDYHIDSLKMLEMPVTVRYSLSIPKGGEDHLYFNPMLCEAMKENPFAAAERKYPVELPFAVNDLFVLQMDIPAGYEVEEAPKSVKLTLGGEDGIYEYGIAVTEQSLQVRRRLVVRKTFFQAQDYVSLRDFFGQVVKKEGEMIVFRKKG